MSSFEDHFRRVAVDYAKFRPRYSAELFAWLAEQVPRCELAVDCGAGSGQASFDLLGHFDHVLAVEPSASQLSSRRKPTDDEPLAFVCGSSETLPLADDTADLVCVAQAAHWFDLPRFYEEARRVLRSDSLIAIWSYAWCRIAPDIDEIVDRFALGTLDPYWPGRREWVNTGYASLPFVEDEIEAPSFELREEWSLDQLLGYFGSWSAVSRFRQDRGEDPIPALRDELLPVWDDSVPTRTVIWPLNVRAGRV